MSVTAKGPNLATYRSNNFMKAMEKSRVFGHSEETSNLYDSRSVNDRRDSSLKSIRSVCDFQPKSYNFCQYSSGTSSQSVCNFQNTNPGGLLPYVTATEIALSLQYSKFNHLDLKILQKGIRCFQNRLKNYDSGEQGSNSSLSNDDDDIRSTRSYIFKENMSSYKSTYAHSSSPRVSSRKRVHKSSSRNSTQQNHVRYANTIKNDNLSNNFQGRTVSGQPSQKYHFKNRYLLPSQRFNKSLVPSALIENIPTIQPTVKNGVNKEPINNNKDTVLNKTSESINEEIFSINTVENNNTRAELSCKRKLEDDTAVLSNKKPKLSPIKKISNNNLTGTESVEIMEKDKTYDFSFVKLSFPKRKSCKDKINKTATSEYAQTSVHTGRTSQLESSDSHNLDKSLDKSACDPTENSSSDLSNRPSFIKRKLFTQKLDVAENRIISFGNVNSPIRASSQIQKQKNKTRKLVSNLTCLNRDDTKDTNYVELIHRIVLPDLIDSTCQRNKVVDRKDGDVNNSDVTSIISECNSKDGSNTYTYEEFFENNSKDSTKQKKSKKGKQLKDCYDVLENGHEIISNSNIISTTSYQQEKETNLEPKGNNEIKSVIISDTFWDSDLDSDVESQNKLKNYPEQVIKDKVSDKCQNNDESTAIELTKSIVVKNNLTSNISDNVSVCNPISNNKGTLNTRNYKIRSHREINKCCTTELKIPVITITRLPSNFNFKDACSNTDNDKVNNKPAENKKNGMKKNENEKTSSQICKSKHTEKDNAKKYVNRLSVAKGNLNKQTKPKNNDNRRQTKQKNTMSNKVLESSKYESDVSFSLLDCSSVLTRSRTRAFVKLINDSTSGNTRK